MSDIKLLGFLINMDLARRRVSATNSLLYHHLRQKDLVSAIIDVNLSGVKDKYCFFKNISLNKELWLYKYMLDHKRKQLMSRLAREKFKRLPKQGGYDATLQIGSMFNLHYINELRDFPKFSYHDNNILAYLKSAHKKPYLKTRLSRAISFEKEVYDNLSAIFTMTEYLRRSFIKDFNIDESKVFNIGFGTNMDVTPDFEKNYDGKTVLFVAKDSFREKGGVILLEAFQKIKAEIKEAKLIIVGQNKKVNMDGVESFGFIDKNTEEGAKKISELYRKASLFIMPSFVEAAGSVFLEAMAYKTPCIGANVSAMPEIIENSGSGYVVNPDDSTELAKIAISILKSNQHSKYLGDNGFYAVQNKYNWDVVCSKLYHTIKKFI